MTVSSSGRRRLSLLRKVNSPFFILIAPAGLFLLLMIAFPLVFVFRMSMEQYLVGLQSTYIGLQNYMTMLQDPVFWNGLRVTLLLFFMSLVLQLVIGLYIAMLLNRAFAGKRFLRTILISPLAMPPVAVGMMWLILLDPRIGPVQYLLQSVGLPQMLFLASTTQVLPTLAMIDTWQYTPLIVLIILGGLQSLPSDPYESALIDGANAVQRFFYITLPLLRASIVTAAVLRSIDLLRFFDTIYITTQGGPARASTTLNIYAYQTGFVHYRMGYGSALMVVLFLCVLLVVLLLSRFRRMGE